MSSMKSNVSDIKTRNVEGIKEMKLVTDEVYTNEEFLIANKEKGIKIDDKLLHKVDRKLYFFVKRIFDVIGALFGLLVIIPVAIITKISYLCSGDKKSIFYKNADEILVELLKDEKYKNEWKLYQKFENDPRITKVGNILRKTSLDELPQFINVLKGDMSLIGPRPLVPGELDLHNGNHKIYESVRPGVSGWWACNGRSATTYKKRLELEYYYCENCSLLLDIKCVLLTIKAVIFKYGAK